MSRKGGTYVRFGDIELASDSADISEMVNKLTEIIKRHSTPAMHEARAERVAEELDEDLDAFEFASEDIQAGSESEDESSQNPWERAARKQSGQA